MLFIYNLLLNLIIIFSPFIIFFRLLKKKEDFNRFKEKFCFFYKKNFLKKKLIWFHASSVGEILSIIPLIEKLEKNKFIGKILITSTTLSSSKVLLKYKLKKTIHQFFPIDSKFFTERFLNYWRPSIAIFIESEIWPNMIINIKKKNIPLVLLNARISNKSFKRWKLLNNFSNFLFKKFDLCFPQNNETKNYLNFLGAKKIKLIGNLKFTESKCDNEVFLNKSFIKQFNNRKVWCASSTHADEELDCAKVHQNLKKKHKNLLTIIIPRHVHRVNEIQNKLRDLGLNVICRSSNKKITKNTNVYLVDTYGETKKFYKLSKTVFLGGSLLSSIKHGGQNPIEPARLGSTIIHGPNINNFKEVYKLFFDKKISFKAKNLFELTKLIDRSITKSRNSKNKYLKIKKLENTILAKAVNEINVLLKNEIKKA